MLASFFYTNEAVRKEEMVEAFIKLAVSKEAVEETEGYDDEADIAEGLKGLAMAICALWPTRSKKTGEIMDTLSGPEAEKLFRQVWVESYAKTLKRHGFPVPNPIGEGEFNPKDEKQVHDFIEAGNSPDWNNPAANGEIPMPRWLLKRTAEVVGEVDGDRTADFYKYARERKAKEEADETRDPETKS
jgi:hypothetical protein